LKANRDDDSKKGWFILCLLLGMNVLLLRFVTILCIWWKALAMSMELTTLRIWITFKKFLFNFHYSLIFINSLFCILCLIKKKNAAVTYCFRLPARKPHMFVKLCHEICTGELWHNVTFLTLALEAV
jgi:hypothetical protein